MYVCMYIFLYPQMKLIYDQFGFKMEPYPLLKDKVRIH